jgi:hypothetical protein
MIRNTLRLPVGLTPPETYPQALIRRKETRCRLITCTGSRLLPLVLSTPTGIAIAGLSSLRSVEGSGAIGTQKEPGIARDGSATCRVNFAPHGPRLDTTYLCRALTSGGREQRGHSPINLNRRIGSLPQGALSEMEAAIQPARFNLPSNLPSIQNALIFGLRDWLIPPRVAQRRHHYSWCRHSFLAGLNTARRRHPMSGRLYTPRTCLTGSCAVRPALISKHKPITR